MPEQQRDLRGAFAQRRHHDRQYIQPVIEVFAETSILHRFLHIHVRGCQYAHIGIDQVPSAKSRILVILQHVQQLRL